MEWCKPICRTGQRLLDDLHRQVSTHADPEASLYGWRWTGGAAFSAIFAVYGQYAPV